MYDSYGQRNLAFKEQEAVSAKRAELIQQNSGLVKLLRLLEPLNKTPTGRLVFSQVKRILSENEYTQHLTQQAYASIICALLDAMLGDLPENSQERVSLKLLQTLTQPPLAHYELDALRGLIVKYALQTSAKRIVDPSLVENAIEPLLKSFGMEEKEEEVSVSRDQSSAKGGGHVGLKINMTYRRKISRTREDIQRLQQELSHKIQSIIAPHEEFNKLLGSMLARIRGTNNVEDLQKLRLNLISEAEEMVRENRTLTDKLDSTRDDLNELKADSQKLTDELTRAHLLSLTDELTELPNRRAFIRHLEDELGRAQRYDSPLTVALIDIDHFKEINDRFGHGVGDAVLRTLAKNILSIFRHHDMVSRYGGEEFAVVFPNTTIQGAVAALNKVLRRARLSRFKLRGTSYRMPTLSAGVSQYRSGETESELIERADHGLYRAKNLGRDRCITEKPVARVQAMEG